MSLRRFLYSVIAYALLPLILLRLAWRSRQQVAYRQRWAERFAFKLPNLKPATPQAPRLLIHTVSVGEAIAARPLVAALLAHYPSAECWLTATTPTGSATLQRLWQAEWGRRIQHCYLPYDLPDAAARLLNRLKPSAVLILETELWPNLYAVCAQRHIPLCLLNARLSERSFKRYQYLAGLVRETLENTKLIAARESLDAERFIALGAPVTHVQVTGNIKFDLQVPADAPVKAQQWRKQWAGRPVWVAASTHAGEEAHLLNAQQRLLHAIPNALLILVPRHPERFTEVAGLCQVSGLQIARRSLQQLPQADTQVWLADSMGELAFWYASSDIAFIGGSFVPIGGHNPLEALIFKTPVLSGALVHNFAELYADLVAVGGARLIESADDLADDLAYYFANPAARTALGQAGHAYLRQHQGVVARLLVPLSVIIKPSNYT